MKAIIGKKVGMSQIFDEMGKVIPVTVIEAGPCVVVQKKTVEKDGYNAVQLGFEDVSEKRLTKPEMGHLNKANVGPKKYLREFDLDNAAELNIGDVVKADTFKEGEWVDVTGTSKGHGYQGVVKRYNAGRTPMSHGGGPVHRHAGSMGPIDPAHIFKGKIGAGQMGNEQVTVLNLDVVKVDDENNLNIVNRLHEAGLQMVSQEEELQLSTKLAGKSIVISGVFSQHSRDEYKQMIEAHGGKNVGSISKKTSFVLAGDNMGPEKRKKAERIFLSAFFLFIPLFLLRELQRFLQPLPLFHPREEFLLQKQA